MSHFFPSISGKSKESLPYPKAPQCAAVYRPYTSRALTRILKDWQNLRRLSRIAWNNFSLQPEKPGTRRPAGLSDILPGRVEKKRKTAENFLFQIIIVISISYTKKVADAMGVRYVIIRTFNQEAL
jgi:hypothetical protein